MNRNVSKSAVASDLLKIVEVAAKIESPVLIAGDDQGAREFFARVLHLYGARREKPFVCCDCAHIENLAACVKEAGEGTLFVDDMAALDSVGQESLLSFLRGSNLLVPGGVRIVAATSQDLERLVQAGQFNADLLIALGAVLIRIPPRYAQPGENLLQNELAALFDKEGHKTLKDAENVFKKCYIQSVLNSTGFNQTKAAEILGIQRTYLSRLLTELGIRR